jgi:hypothetical protein
MEYPLTKIGSAVFRPVNKKRLNGDCLFFCQTVAEMEGVTRGIRPEGEKHVTIALEQSEEDESMGTKNTKYTIRSKYGNIPVRDKKDKAKCELYVCGKLIFLLFGNRFVFSFLCTPHWL